MRSRRYMLAVSVVGLALGLAACGSGGDEATVGSEAEATGGARQSWAVMIAERHAASEDEFERAVLEDGVITAAELSEAIQRANQCMTDHGLVHSRGAIGTCGFNEPDDINPGWTFMDCASTDDLTADLTLADEEQSRECASIANFILAAYNGMRDNPDNLDPNELWLACMVRQDLAPEGFTLEDHWALNPHLDPTRFAENPCDDPQWLTCECDADGGCNMTRNPDYVVVNRTPSGHDLWEDPISLECQTNPGNPTLNPNDPNLERVLATPVTH